MKKILLSFGVIAIVAIGVIGATRAYFSDTKLVTGNTFTTGTIDISVGTEDIIPVTLNDMKPSQVAYSNFTINNTGTNPVNVTKTIKNIVTSDPNTNEPECIDEGGIWVNDQCTSDQTHPWLQKHDIETTIQYDLSVKVYDENDRLVWNQTLNDMDKTIADKLDNPSFLGMIPAGYHMDVVESYHMNKDTTNWAQSDNMSFDILLSGEQLTGTAILSNKDQNRPEDNGWFVLGDKTGTLTYGVKDSKFNYTFTGTAPLANTGYSLVMYEEPISTPSSPEVWPRPVIIIGSGTTDGGGAMNIADSVDTGDMINAKIWLVKTSDLVGNTLSGWNPTDYLFDTGMLDYYKS